MKLKNKIQSWEIDGAAYPERLHLRVTGSHEAIMEIRAFMESTKPAGIPEHIQQQANAWMAVCSALDEAAPEWRDGEDNAKNMAVAAIKALAAKPAKPKPLAFDLEAAKAGAAVNWLGGAVRWIGLSDKHKDCTNIVEHDGGLSYVSDSELRMVPKPKRTVYANIYPDGRSPCKEAYFHDNEDIARAKAKASGKAIAIAVPIEIDA